MKIRTSFVTNSSSSSFLICHNNTLTQNQENLLEAFVKEHSPNESKIENLKKQAIDIIYSGLHEGTPITNEKDLRKIFEYEYDLSECEAVVNKYNKYLKNLQNGKNLTEVCIDRDYGSIPLNLYVKL